MTKDKRVKTVTFRIRENDLTCFWQLFETVPKSTVAKHLGIHYKRMDKMVHHVTEIKFKDLLLLSRYFEIEPEEAFRLMRTQHTTGSKPKLRKHTRRIATSRKKKKAKKKTARKTVRKKA